ATADADARSVTDALRAATGVSAAGDGPGRSPLAVGDPADLVVLGDSPWADPAALADVGVWATVVDGAVGHGPG
ncbi:MAG: amidohydrolase, partial [Halobacteriaceae archaeon]